jgi:hypothetical protein
MSLVVGSAPWITAFEVEPLAEQRVEPTPEASAPLKAVVKGLNGIAIRNQGLLDKRERSEVVQTLTYLRDHGVRAAPRDRSSTCHRQEPEVRQTHPPRAPRGMG